MSGLNTKPLALVVLLAVSAVAARAQSASGSQCQYAHPDEWPCRDDEAGVEARRKRNNAEVAESIARYRAKKAAEEKKREAARLAEIKKREAAREAQIASLDVTAEGKDRLRRHEVWLGATPEMARLAWGHPQSINRTITTGQVSEQWVYGLGTYLYFTNGKLTSIQQESGR